MICFNDLKCCARWFYYGGWGVVFACVLAQIAWAHTSLEKYLRERVCVYVGPENIDIRIQFSFPAALSLVERRSMDKDGDGQVSTKEQEAYLNDIQVRVEQQLKLSVNGQSAMVIPLEDAVLDLQDAPGVEAHSHELHVACFARLSREFGVGGTIVLDSGLWTETPLMISVSLQGAEGIRFQTIDTQGLRQPSKDSAIFRVTEGRCIMWECGGNKNGRK